MMIKKIICIAAIIITGGIVSLVFSEGFHVPKDRVYPHIITPNGDGFNDIFWVFYVNPMDSEVYGKIYDIDGAFVGDMFHKTGSQEYSLCWDGTDGSDHVVPGGVYIYQIIAEDSVYHGTVVVAR